MCLAPTTILMTPVHSHGEGETATQQPADEQLHKVGLYFQMILPSYLKRGLIRGE